jgi:uncharacterized membrane protein YdbT with pleckstrin-like domain
MSGVFGSSIVMQEELRADETILHVAHRHVIVLLLRVVFPLLILAGSLGLVGYRVSRPLVIEPFDLITITCIGIALLALLLIVYLYVDWKKDQIVLTDQRVIYNIEKPLIRRTQEQLPINDIHQVEAITHSYPEHWLKYGSIEVQSAAFAHPMIFRGVSHPQRLQERMMRLIHSLKQDQADVDDFRDMVNRRIYHDEPPQPAHAPTVRHANQPRMLHWLFHENPHYDEDSRTYTWHPHWVFLLQALFKPSVLMVVALAIALGGAQMNLFTWNWTAGILLGIGIVAVGWAAWEIEDHRNDRYILTPSQVIDIEKQPFGPENQSSASLDSIQNVTYTTTLVSRILGYGDVWLELAGSGDQLTFYQVPHPRDVVSAIDSYQGAFNRSQKERNLEDTLHLLNSYHELQQEQAPTDTTAAGNGSTRPMDNPKAGQQTDDALLKQLLHEQQQT